MRSTLRFSTVEVFLLISLSVFGSLALLWLPLGGGYDEETHFIRAWQMSTLDLLPNKVGESQIPYPSVYWELSYRRQVLVKTVSPDFWEKYGDVSIDSGGYIYGVRTRSVYSPLLLLPQAIVLRYAGRALKLPALPVFYLTRLAGLLFYGFLVWEAVRLIPYGKWTIALLALSPTALLQAVTVSADAISNGIAFFFIATVLAISTEQEIGQKEWLKITFVSFLLFAAKINLVFLILLPLLIIPPNRFSSKKAYMLLFGIISLFFFLEVVGWSIIAYPRLGTAPAGTNPSAQIKFIFSHPVFFLKTIKIDVFSHFFIRLKNWLAIYGYDYWPVPNFTYAFYGGALFLSLFAYEPREISPKRHQRIILLLLFVFGYVTTLALMYLSFTPVGSPIINGVQGRYFIVVMPLLFLALVNKYIIEGKYLTRAKRGAVILGVLSLVSYTSGLWLSYHIPCGSQYYQGDICYQPNYKNFSPESNYSAPLTENLILKQEIIPECKNLTTLRVWVSAPHNGTNAYTTFSFQDSDGQTIFEQRVKNSNLPDSGWYSFSFPPEKNSFEKPYFLTIRSKSGLRIAYSLHPEYPQGKLYENKKIVEQDMIFQYGCLFSLLKK